MWMVLFLDRKEKGGDIMTVKRYVICPICGFRVELTEGGCFHCPNCGYGECGYDYDSVIEVDERNEEEGGE